MVAGLAWLQYTEAEPEPNWRGQQGGPWIDRGEASAGGSQSWGNKYDESPAQYGSFEQSPGGTPGCSRCRVLQDNTPPGPSGPPGPGGNPYLTAQFALESY